MLRSFFPLLGMLLLAQPLQAQDDERSQADYEDKPGFGGPESVTEQLKHADELRETMYDWPVFDGYLDWKKQIKEDYDVSFGLHFYGLYQKASDSLPGRDDDAMGNVFRFLGNWTVFEKDNGNLGRIEWRVESRSDWFGLQAPGSLGGATGTTALVPGFGYSDNFDMDLAVINWTQGFASGKAGYAVGRLAFDAYLDAFPFQTFSRGFINRSFILNPTLPTTGIGALGGVVQGFVTDNIWLGGQMHDANAASAGRRVAEVRRGRLHAVVRTAQNAADAVHLLGQGCTLAGRRFQRQRLGRQRGLETQRYLLPIRSIRAFRRWWRRRGRRCDQRRRRDLPAAG
jgi:hypothetical protein